MFWTYLAFAIDKVFFPIYISESLADSFREGAPDPYVNLIPFYFGPYASFEGSFISSVQNILLTIPFGFGLHSLVQLKPKHYLWIAPALGLTFEGLQYILSLLLGYLYRFVDINDLFFNALGVLIGYGLLRVFAFLYLAVTKRFNIEPVGISAYVYRVAAHAQARG
ncbi:MAG: VanZ family protein [Chloroflexota bacterium]